MNIDALEEMADRLRSGEECADDSADLIDEAIGAIGRMRGLLLRGQRQIGAWHEFFGTYCNGPMMVNVLPPAGDVRWSEDVDEALLHNAELKGGPR